MTRAPSDMNAEKRSQIPEGHLKESANDSCPNKTLVVTAANPAPLSSVAIAKNLNPNSTTL